MARVLRSLEKRVTKLKEVAKEAHDNGHDEECVDRIMDYLREDMGNSKRKPPMPRPEGGISINAASRKHSIATSTICGWIKQGVIRVIEKRKNWTYISEEDLDRVAEVHKKYPGRGRGAAVRKLTKI